jgi:Cu/Ag efflux protein CusF
MKSLLAITLGAAATVLLSIAALAQDNTSTITRVDEATGTIAISQIQGTTGSSAGSATQEYKVRDGLFFNAVKEGDKVSFTFEEKDGKKTITKLQKQ